MAAARFPLPEPDLYTLVFLPDGDDRLAVTRASDDVLLRDFGFRVEDGALVPHARSAMDFEPAYDHLAPRVVRHGANTYEFVETIWIESPVVN